MARFALALAALALAGCGRGQFPVKVPPEAAPPPPAATTTLSPPPGPFNDRVTVTFTTDRPATVFVATDGSDPRHSQTRLSGPSPFKVELTRTTTVTFHSQTPEGGEESPRTATYTRAGGAAGTISGVVVVGTLATGKEVALSIGGELVKLGKRDSEGELPFFVSDVRSGQHRLSAIADRNGDGQFWPFLDYASDALVVTIDLNDPFKSSAENVRLYLGASQPGLATIKGTVTLPDPPSAQSLSISAVSAEGFTGGADPTALLAQLQNGYRVFTNTRETRYPYVITDLKPERYVPVPVLLGFGDGGLAMNFIAHPLRALNLGPNDVGIADFQFGPVGLSGTITLKPAAPPQGLVYGIVAARHTSFTSGIQAVLMPTVFLPQPGSTELKGNYAGQALRDNATFQLRVFTSLESQNPLASALTWAINPFSTQPPQSTVPTGNADVKHDLTIP